MANRIGPKMAEAVGIVSHNPGCSILVVARHLHRACWNGNNNALGYNPVHRAIRAGLLEDCPAGVDYRPSNRGLYRLFTPEQVRGARAASAVEAFARACNP